MSAVGAIFKECVSAIRNGVLVEREGRQDKEFHFQNWFKDRLDSIRENYDQPSRNTYPDFKLVRHAEGYEIKGLAYPRCRLRLQQPGPVRRAQRETGLLCLRAVSEETRRQSLSRS